MAQLRHLIGAAGEIAEFAYQLPDNVPAAIDHAEALVLLASAKPTWPTPWFPSTRCSPKASITIEALYEQGDTITGIPTGFYDLDNVLSGMHGGDMIVLGARPAVGKTALALDIARHIAFDRRPTRPDASRLEMSRKQITQRLFARPKPGSTSHPDPQRPAHRDGLAQALQWPSPA